jgi:hypothetical protein
MLMIQARRRILSELGELPAITRAGIVILVAAGIFDVVIHLVAGEHGASHSGIAHVAHLLGIVGMVLVLAGVVAHGTRRHFSSRRRAATHPGGTRDAHR